jgi:hypothetical protein
MDEKKSEAREEEEEQLGPYQLHEQVLQSAQSQDELYLASHETSGATALVLKLAAEKGAAPLKDWQVLLSASDSRGYIAMQVEHTPWAVAPDKQSAESLVFTFEGVHEAVRRMARAVSDTHEPRLRWRQGLVLASAAAGALLFALVWLATVSPPPDGAEPVASAAATPTSHDVLASANTLDAGYDAWISDNTPLGEPAIARPLPREPLKGQKRPPCTRYVEVELVGACWAPHELKAPCPETIFEYQGKCYLPSFSAKPPPQSLGQ